VGNAETPAPRRFRAALLRAAGFSGFWLLLSRPWEPAPAAAALAEIAVGLVAAALATWVSLRLLPPAPGRLRLGVLARLVGRFLWQSLVGGLDVARRAFDPRLPLNPGYLRHPSRLPDGTSRAVYGALTSLVPGTLPVGSAPDGSLIYHCLDLDQPIAEGLARDEALLAGIRTHGGRGE
jgi:multicomponent Na+:H+ antiporter subunit E